MSVTDPTCVSLGFIFLENVPEFTEDRVYDNDGTSR